MNKLAESFRPHAVLTYWAYPDGQCAVTTAKKIGIPCVLITGGSDVNILAQTHSWRRLVMTALSKADAVVAVSEDLRTKLEQLGIPAQKVHVVRRGVDGATFKLGNRQQARIALGLPTSASILLWVGRMTGVKGLSVLLRALERLDSEGVRCETLLIGNGELSGKVAKEIQERGLSACVRMIGAVPHQTLATYYQAADLTVLPSLSEGVPNVLLESITCGTPFIASAVGGIPEIATMNLDRLVPAGDAEALAIAIREQLRISAAAATRRDFYPYDWSTSAHRLIDVLDPLIQSDTQCSPQ